jgi:hypothetical protein
MSESIILSKGQYILCPLSYKIDGIVKVETPFFTESEFQKGKPRLTLKAYLNINFLGSPVFRKESDKETGNVSGVVVFIPKVPYEWSVVQIQSVFERSAFGIPVNLDEGLLLSYGEFCREKFNNNLFFNEEKKVIQAKDINLPSFEEWMTTKEGYISSIEREKRKNIRIELQEKDKEIENLSSKIKAIKEGFDKKMETVREALLVLKSDLKSLEIEDEEIKVDLKKLSKEVGQ